MSDTTSSLDSFTEDDISDNLKVLFGESSNLADLSSREDFAAALCNLTAYFLIRNKLIEHKPIFDPVAINMVAARFARDAHGARQYHALMQELQANGEISPNAYEKLKEEFSKVGVRINTEAPRKTKIAAAFTLWMCAFRPVSFANCQFAEGWALEDVGCLHAIFTFWLCATYLSLFGDVTIDEQQDSDIRMQRIFYDFTFRNLNLSSLEMLYCSVFRPR